jgi:spermidine synthase
MNGLGRHLLIDLYDCDESLLDDQTYIEAELKTAAEAAGARILGAVFHRFSPHGVTGVLVVQESHLAVHTWPERRYAAIDLFTCGSNIDPWLAYKSLKRAFAAQRDNVAEISRGLVTES